MLNASAYFTLEKVDGKHDVKHIKRELDSLPGVSSVSVDERSGQVAVDFDTTGTQEEQIKNQLEKMGYQVVDS